MPRRAADENLLPGLVVLRILCYIRLVEGESRRHVDGVEADPTIPSRCEGAVKSDLRAGSNKTILVNRA